MKQRLRDSGGRLTVESDANGTIIMATVPSKDSTVKPYRI
jgi:signal transduction histidine kinase